MDACAGCSGYAFEKWRVTSIESLTLAHNSFLIANSVVLATSHIHSKTRKEPAIQETYPLPTYGSWRKKDPIEPSLSLFLKRIYDVASTGIHRQSVWSGCLSWTGKWDCTQHSLQIFATEPPHVVYPLRVERIGQVANKRCPKIKKRGPGRLSKQGTESEKTICSVIVTNLPITSIKYPRSYVPAQMVFKYQGHCLLSS